MSRITKPPYRPSDAVILCCIGIAIGFLYMFSVECVYLAKGLPSIFDLVFHR